MTLRTLFCFTFLASFLLGGCGTLFEIDLTVVGEKTALERQVLGTYQDLGRDLTVYSSVRAVQPDGSLEPPPPTTESQREVLRAINNRRYNRDDLDTLLSAGVLGEANDGLVMMRQSEQLPVGDLTSDLVDQILEEENQDRETIIARLVKTTPGVTEGQRGEVAWIFAQLNQDLAPAGAPVQNREGEWRQK